MRRLFRFRTSGRRILLLLTVWMLRASAWASEGVLLMGDDPIRVGRGGASVASPESASCITLNPAGMVDLERRIDFSTSAVLYQVTLRTNGIAKIPVSNEVLGERLHVGHFEEIGEIHYSGKSTDTEFVGLPSMAAVWPRENDAFGVSLHIPAGARVHYPHSRTWVGLIDGDTDRNLDFAQPRLTLAYAYKFDSDWAVGIALNGSLSIARTDHATPQLVSTTGDNEWDYALGAGFSLGVYRKWDRWSFGAGVTSRQWSQVFDKYRDVTPYPVDLPTTAQAGVAYRIRPNLELELDYRFINWSDTNFFHEDNINNGFGWDDQHVLMCGLEWKATPRWTFRTGYSHATLAFAHDHVFGSGLAPDIVTDHASVGFSCAVGEHSDFHVTYAHWFEQTRTESGNGDFYSAAGKGSSIQLGADWLTLGYSLKF